MRACVAGQALHAFGQVYKLLYLGPCIVGLTKILALLQRFFQSNSQLARNQLSNFINSTIAHAQCLAHVAHRRPRLQRAEGNNLRHALLSVAAHNIIKHLVALNITKIGINIRHTHALGVQKAFKEQVVAQWLNIRYAQKIGHNAACRTAASWSDRNIVLTTVVDKIPYDQKIAGIAHGIDNIQLKIQTPAHTLINYVITHRQCLLAQMTQIAHCVITIRHGELRQQQMAKLHSNIAAVGNFIGVCERFGAVAKKLLHLIIALQIKAVVRKAHPIGVIHAAGRLDAQQDVLRRRVLALHIMQVVGRHKAQVKLLRQLL